MINRGLKQNRNISLRGAMNRDQFNTGGNPVRLRQAAYRCISRTQDDPSTQVQGMALALFATCRALNVDIKQLLVSIERMERDLNGPFVSTFRALEAYARNEIGRRT